MSLTIPPVTDMATAPDSVLDYLTDLENEVIHLRNTLARVGKALETIGGFENSVAMIETIVNRPAFARKAA